MLRVKCIHSWLLEGTLFYIKLGMSEYSIILYQTDTDNICNGVRCKQSVSVYCTPCKEGVGAV